MFKDLVIPEILTKQAVKTPTKQRNLQEMQSFASTVDLVAPELPKSPFDKLLKSKQMPRSSTKVYLGSSGGIVNPTTWIREPKPSKLSRSQDSQSKPQQTKSKVLFSCKQSTKPSPRNSPQPQKPQTPFILPVPQYFPVFTPHMHPLGAQTTTRNSPSVFSTPKKTFTATQSSEQVSVPKNSLKKDTSTQIVPTQDFLQQTETTYCIEPRAPWTATIGGEDQNLAESFLKHKKKVAQQIKQREESIPKTANKQKSKSKLLSIRKAFLQPRKDLSPNPSQLVKLTPRQVQLAKPRNNHNF